MINTRKKWLKTSALETQRKKIEEYIACSNLQGDMTKIVYILYSLHKATNTKTLLLRTFFPEFIEAVKVLPTLQLDISSCGYLIDYILQSDLSQQLEDGEKHSQRKKRGAFFTPYPIAYLIVENTIDHQKSSMSILDPACGTGVFLSAAAEFLKKLGKSNLEISHLLHGWDINQDSLKIAQCLLAVELGLNETAQKRLLSSNQFIAKDTIIEPIENDNLFFQRSHDKYDFDYIVTNPPYDRLKADSGSTAYKKTVSDYVSIIRKSNKYPLSSDGSVDLYRLFVERVLQIRVPQRSKIGLIIPASFCSDKNAQKLRSSILAKNIIDKALFIPERIKAFEGVTQSFVILILKSDEKNNIFSTGLVSKKDAEYSVSNPILNCTESVLDAFPDEKNIIHLCKTSYSLIRELNKFPKIKDLSYIRNKRGELDLSLKRQYLGYGQNKLIRGAHVQEYSISKNLNLVDYEGFVSSIKGTSKFDDINAARICCQQISNMDSAKRLKFAYVDKNLILGNSLNYIASSQSKDYLYGLMTVLNSLLLDWRFRISSSNNHVNNYEIDQLPLPDDVAAIEKIGRLFLSVQCTIRDGSIRALIEKEVLNLYGCMSYEEFLVSTHPLGEVFLNYSESKEKQYA